MRIDKMKVTDRALQIIRLNDSRSRLLAGAAALALATGVAGVLLGKSMAPSSQVEATTSEEEGEHAEEGHGAEEGESREGFVAMTPPRMKASGILVERVEPGSLMSEIIAQATVKAPPEGQAVLTARADGAVVRINRRLGDPVGRGQTVALLESREAETFVAERNAAAARAQAARAAAAREQRLFNARITARQDLEAAIAARRTAEADLHRAEAAVRAAGVTGGHYMAVRSPISGRITEMNTQLGAYVSAGAELFHVANEGMIQVEAAVPANETQRIQPADRAMVELPNGGVAEANVRSITPSVDPQSRAATVVLQMFGAPGGLRQGQGVRVRIIPRGSEAGGIVLPEIAVQQVEGRDTVFVQVKGGFQAVPVSVGSRGNGRVEILDGLRFGQMIATEGAFVLKSQLGASEAGHGH